MKRNFRITILSALLPVFVLLLVIQGCKKESVITDPGAQNGELWLTGSVIDAQTHAGIANATVNFNGHALTTDAAGKYKVNCSSVSKGTQDVRVKADGYGYGFASANITSSAAMVKTILLKSLSAPVSVGQAGGTLSTPDPESLSAGGQTTLTIPANAFTTGVEVSLTRFTGMDVPGYAPANSLNLCAVNLAPAGTVASGGAELRFPLPFSDPAISTLPLLRYDFESNTWNSTGAVAQVNQSTGIATVQVTEFGTYSLAVPGSFSETNGTSGTPFTMQLSPSLSSVDLSYLAAIEYTSLLPVAISPVFLSNLASQNTVLNGLRVSFTDSTTVTFNYIGSKPDSLAPVKSTTAGYYKWVPKVSSAMQHMPTTTVINGVSVAGIITKELFTDACGWQYTHDQGGGGK
jgi:hypothetical protein